MTFAHQLLADEFARAACEMLIGMSGLEGAYREVVALLDAADDDMQPMYLEIIAALDIVRAGRGGAAAL